MDIDNDMVVTGESSKTKENPSQNDNTFLVLVTRRGKAEVRRFSKAKSLYLFPHKHPVRKCCIFISTVIYFEYFILITILANCVFLALKNPPEEAEYVFATLYTLEMFVKIIARGFLLHKHAYLRDPWNVLDFVVVILGWLTVTPYLANLSGVRTFRVLRALRTISQTKGLKTMVNTLLVSMRMLSDVLVLIIFFLCVFALVGMQLFMGELRNKCVETFRHNNNRSFVSFVGNMSLWFMENNEPVVCGNTSSSRMCPSEYNYSCYAEIGSNPNYGYTSFDHIGWSLLALFQLFTLDYWENVYNNVLYAAGLWNFFFFATFIFLGPFYSKNLISAVVVTSYEVETLSINEEDAKNGELIATAMSAFTLPFNTKLSSNVNSNNYASTYTGNNCDSNLDNNTESNGDSKLHNNTKNSSNNGDSNYNNSSNNVESSVNNIQKYSVENVDNDVDINDNCKNTKEERESYGRKISETIVDKPDDEIYQLRELDKKLSTNNHNISRRRICWFRGQLNNLVSSREFEAFITICIVSNTVVMATEHHGMSSSLEMVISVSNYVFTSIFFAEVVLKLAAFGVKKFFRKSWCVFDFLVVVISIVDIVLELSRTTGVGLRVLRTFRLLRVLKLAKSWTTMNNLLSATAKSLGAFVNLALVMCIVLYMFAITGMQLFADSYTHSVFGSQIPRWNFVDFPHSLMLIFRVVCGEWIEPLWDCMRASKPSSVLLFIPAFIMGNFIVLNLFLALVVNSFSHEDLPVAQEGEKVISRIMKSALSVSFSVVNVIKRSQVYPVKESRRSHDNNATSLSTENNGTSVPINPAKSSFSLSKKLSGHRATITAVVQSKFFEWFILFTITLSSICLAFEDINLREDKDLQYVLHCLDIAFVVIFSLEFMLKLIGLGFFKYFTKGWNYLDFSILIISFLSLILSSDLAAFRSLRTLRALRPLRAISRFEGLKIVIGSLFSAIPGISNVLLVGLLSWLIFSIMGVQLFAGKFYKCIDPGAMNGDTLPAALVSNKTICLEKGFQWVNSYINFDNVLKGLVALTQVATLEGWIEIMRDAVDATGVDEQPEPENNLYAYIYFVVFIILGSFFVLNLIVGVIIDKFSRVKQLYEDTGSTGIFLSNQQIDWLNTLKKAASKKPSRSAERPKNQLRGILFDIVTNTYFEMAIMLIIALNMTAMMIEHYGQSEKLRSILDFFNYFFTGIFIAEAVVRITALGTFYFRLGWNIFDFIVVLMSVIGILLETLKNFQFVKLSVLRGVRAFRVTRLLRFIKVAKGVRKLTFAFVLSLPALFNIGCLLALIISIYAIIGMTSFGDVKKTGALNNVVNFETFLHSFVLLFRLMTSAGWNEVLDSLMIEPPYCDHTYRGLNNGDCGRPIFAQFYFVSFVIVTYIILVNMYVAIILENFNRIYKKAKVGITDDDLDMYYSKWALYDPKATEYIHFAQVSQFVDELDPPLRVQKSGSGGVEAMDIPLRRGDRVHCLDMLHGLVKHLVLKEFPKGGGGGYSVAMERLEERFMKTFPRRNLYPTVSTIKQKTLENRAALVIQRAVKRFKASQERRRATGNAVETAPSAHNEIKSHDIIQSDEREKSNFQQSKELHELLVIGDRNKHISLADRPLRRKSSQTLKIPPIRTIPAHTPEVRRHKVSEDLSLKSVTTENST